MASIAQSVLVMCQLFCFVLFRLSCVCGYGVDFGPYGQFWGSISFFVFIGLFIFVFSPSSSADVKGLLGTFHRCDHIDRVQVKGHGSSTFKTLRPSQRSDLRLGPWCMGSLVHTYIRIHTAGKLGLDVTSVPGSSLQLSYIKWEMADTNSATCTTAYELLVPLQLSLHTRCPFHPCLRSSKYCGLKHNQEMGLQYVEV